MFPLFRRFQTNKIIASYTWKLLFCLRRIQRWLRHLKTKLSNFRIDWIYHWKLLVLAQHLFLLHLLNYYFWQRWISIFYLSFFHKVFFAYHFYVFRCWRWNMTWFAFICWLLSWPRWYSSSFIIRFSNGIGSRRTKFYNFKSCLSFNNFS